MSDQKVSQAQQKTQIFFPCPAHQHLVSDSPGHLLPLTSGFVCPLLGASICQRALGWLPCGDDTANDQLQMSHLNRTGVG